MATFEWVNGDRVMRGCRGKLADVLTTAVLMSDRRCGDIRITYKDLILECKLGETQWSIRRKTDAKREEANEADQAKRMEECNAHQKR